MHFAWQGHANIACRGHKFKKTARWSICRLVNRELVPWVPDDDGTALEDLTLNSQSKKGGQWDQFAANKAQFGVQTSFDEDVSPF